MNAPKPKPHKPKGKLSRQAVFALVGTLALLGACEKQPKIEPNPEADHCLMALERLSKDFTNVNVFKVRDWDVENIKNVSITFDYTIPAQSSAFEDEDLRGLMVCRYNYSIVRRTTKGREVKALAIRFRGRQLSPSELLLIDTAMSGSKSRFKWPK